VPLGLALTRVRSVLRRHHWEIYVSCKYRPIITRLIDNSERTEHTTLATLLHNNLV
jgi:hypothetical protein